MFESLPESSTQIFIAATLFFAATVILAIMVVRVVPKNSIGVRTRFGKIVSTHSAGMQFILPFAEQMVAVDMTPSEVELPKNFLARSAAGERFRITGAFSYQITQAAGALLVTSDPIDAMHNAVRDAVVEYVNQHTFIVAARDTKELAYAVQKAANTALAETFYVRLSQMQLQLSKEK